MEFKSLKSFLNFTAWIRSKFRVMNCTKTSLTFGLLPPMAPGLMEPVSWYRQRILETQPWDTRSWREMTHGRTPWCAISTILWRIWLGRGLPFMKTPPSWLTRPCPNGVDTGQQRRGVSHSWIPQNTPPKRCLSTEKQRCRHTSPHRRIDGTGKQQWRQYLCIEPSLPAFRFSPQ